MIWISKGTEFIRIVDSIVLFNFIEVSEFQLIVTQEFGCWSTPKGCMFTCVSITHDSRVLLLKYEYGKTVMVKK